MDKFLRDNIKGVFDRSLNLFIKENENYVIFSDLHMGDGSRNDDFQRNSYLFSYILENYYLKNGFKLILNGDIEELQRFRFEKIYAQWKNIFNIFESFSKNDNLYKIIGNHDDELIETKNYRNMFKLYEGIKINIQDTCIFIFHGHQASKYYTNHKKMIKFFLKYLANPLGISNYSVSHSNRKKFVIEQNVYNFTRENNIISIVGHTHRPLFESLPKIDLVKFKIEELYRNYNTSSEKKKKKIEIVIKEYKNELESFTKKEIRASLKDTIYGSNIVLPCLFNSGCVRERGITAIEISSNNISLVHYFDKNISKKYIKYHCNQPVRLLSSNFYRVILDQDSLDYVKTKIKLL